MKAPLLFRGELLYPLRTTDSCVGCKFQIASVKVCRALRDAELSRDSTTKGGCVDERGSIIWESGEEGRIAYITERLKS